MIINYQLYFVTEESVPTEELLTIVEKAIQGGVTIVQLREKKNSGRDFFEKAVRLKALTDKYRVPLIINDRVDIALAVGAAGVHVGQQDLPLTEVKKMVPPSMVVGVSCGTMEEAITAEQNGADYMGVGAVFPTNSKEDAKLLPERMLETIISSVSIPVVAIGGINLENIETLLPLKMAGVAVVSEIMKADSSYMAAKNFREVLSQKRV